MGDLIQIKNDEAFLTKETVEKIVDFEKIVADIKKKEEALKTALLEEMREKNVIKLETDELILTYVAPTTRESLDTKAIREELPQIYDTYCKLSTVKESLRIKVKS